MVGRSGWSKVVHRRRGTASIDAIGVAAIAASLAFHQKIVIVMAGRATHGKAWLVGAAVGTSAVAMIVGDNRRWHWRKGLLLTGLVVMMVLI